MPQLYRRAGWATDVHLNFVSLPQWDRFIAEVQHAQIDVLLITGDISESEDLVFQLNRLAEASGVDVVFVLGNHDYYHGSIHDVQRCVRDACAANPRLYYLTDNTPIRAEGGWTICGDDGWADGRVGDYFGSSVRMHDFSLIEELRDLNAWDRWRKLRRLGAKAAGRLTRQLQSIASDCTKLLVLTHIPPFRESCWYEGEHSDDNWAPFFVSATVGWCLRRWCRRHQHVDTLVLCGHTHSGGCSQMEPNLKVWTGAAEYGAPNLAAVLDFRSAIVPELDWVASR